ncbi:MAG: hypothetical protein BWY38_01631 [Ignavibacteria bacterium ADurb.Bin266]|nr:MAG: hypothetical protein BWY38_01631 [Ignavibacteria bacterium ADurb.Bin266]
MGLLIGVGVTRPQFPYDYYYGIEWDTTVSNPKPTRIGKVELHQSLPIQSRMRRCILKDDGTVNYYLHANDSTLRDNSAAANLDGTDGQVMVELPDMYVRFEMEGTKRRCLMSDHQLPGFIKWSKDYVSAYEATVERATSKLASVVNTTADYRGGGNQVDWDALSKTQLGKPATAISLNNFRTYARNRGSVSWNCNTYQIQRKLFWLFAVEYANFNSQDAYNAALTVEGYRQGGLDAGVTTLNGSLWSAFNGYYPVIPCGHTNSLGNRSGVVDYVMPAEYGTLTVQVPSYRGVENPFGHVWKWTDGCKCMIQSGADGGLSEFYVCDNPANFTSSGTANYQLRGNLPRTEGYVKEVILGEYGEIMPLMVGAGSTTYFCDYFYTSIPTSGVSERGVLFGGAADGGATAGFVCANTAATATAANADVGSRLCFIPQIEP